MLEALFSFLQEHYLLLFILSFCGIAFFFISLLSLIPILLFLPEDFFLQRHPVRKRSLLAYIFIVIFKNLFGLILLFSGIIMLFTPGQGVLTIFAAVILLDFPGKRKLEYRLLRSSEIQKALNWIREKRGKAPFLFPE